MTIFKLIYINLFQRDKIQTFCQFGYESVGDIVEINGENFTVLESFWSGIMYMKVINNKYL